MSAAAGPSASLDAYGLSVRVEGDWPEVIEATRLDFAWFDGLPRVADPDVEITVERRPADANGFGDPVASFITPRNAVYHRPGQTIVDHVGRAVSVIDRDGSRLRIHGDDEGIVHDAVYYFLLARVGTQLDARGMLRLHGLGLAGPRGATVVLLPPGGGKSTLALQALRDEEVLLLSEDSPVLDRTGRLHPFPLRIAVNATDAGRPAGGGARSIERLWLNSKLAVEVGSFAHRVATEPQPLRHIVVGRRSLGEHPALDPMPRRAALGALLREGVLGVGLYQGLGYAHQQGPRELAKKAATGIERSRACAYALSRARVWRLTLGRDHGRNWDALRTLLV